MPAFTATAPGKIILFGEHAVVYGRPAIAVPVNQVSARVVVQADPLAPPGRIWVRAPAVGLDGDLDALPSGHPLRAVKTLLLEHWGLDDLPACRLQISSTIPVAAGLGSGAAVSVACLRALSAFLGRRLDDELASALAYEVEKLLHGTPSGIDNTVVTYAAPVYFMRRPEGPHIETFQVERPFTLLIGDTGVSSPTSVAVGDLRRSWQAEPERYNALFDAVGSLVERARALIESGQPEALGPLMDENHVLLQAMDVSSPELDHLVAAARSAGALGAKLSGGGRGGNMIALVRPEAAGALASALRHAGAEHTIITRVAGKGSG